MIGDVVVEYQVKEGKAAQRSQSDTHQHDIVCNAFQVYHHQPRRKPLPLVLYV